MTKIVHRHSGQQRFLFQMAQMNYLVAGRGFGKNTGPLADFSYINMLTMPRSMGQFVAKSFAQALTSTLPYVINGWENLGLVRDIHFKVGGYFPKKTGVPRPHIGPIKTDHIVHFINGSVMVVSSQDRNSAADNGKSCDWIEVDEAKLIDYKRLQEECIIPMRGNMDKFGKLYNHRSMLIATDMPDEIESNWILEAEKHMDKEVIALAASIRKEMFALQIKQERYNSPQHKRRLASKIAKYQGMLNKLLKGETMFMEGYSVENIEILGLDYFIAQAKMLPPRKFLRSFANFKISSNEYFFYPLFNVDKHSYELPNYSHIDNIGLEASIGYKSPDSTFDLDCMRDQPLRVSCDANKDFNCMIVSQQIGKSLKCIKELYIEGDNGTTKDNAQLFCDYYKHHSNKTVYFSYDSTFKAGSAANRKGVNYATDYIETFKKNGWNVIEKYMGNPSTYPQRYRLINTSLKEHGQGKYLKILINKMNCPYLVKLLDDTPRKTNTDRIEKDKSSERNPNIPPRLATHLTEAFDTTMMAILDPIDKSGTREFVGTGIYT